MNKLHAISIFIIGIVEMTFSWGPFVHEKFTAELLLNNPGVYALFLQTGWDMDKVINYAKWADGDPTSLFGSKEFPISEKETFPGWSSVSDYNAFDRDYLSFARAGKMDFHDGYWLSLDNKKIYHPTQEQLTDPVWLSKYKYKSPHVYYGDKLFGVFLHKVADFCVPVNHAPANNWFTSDLAETNIEFRADKEEFINDYLHYCPDKYILANSSTWTDAEKWNNYCKTFENEMQIHALYFRNHEAACLADEGQTLRLADLCLKDGFELANGIVTRYLRAALKLDVPKPMSQLTFTFENVLNPQITFGTPCFVMRINAVTNVPQSARVTFTLRIPDNNEIFHSYSLFDGVCSRQTYVQPWDYLLYQLHVDPLAWPSEEVRKKDGTAGNEFKGYVMIYASMDGFLPYYGYIVVSKGDITLANKNFFK